MLKWIDLPPLWTAAFIVIAWGQSTLFPFGLSFGGDWANFLGGLLIGGGVLLFLLAFVELRRQRTTVIPHQTPTALVQSGIYSRSRNPIYLGDVLVLSGAVLALDAVLSLPLIPIFIWVIEKRFILPEEDKLRRNFRMDFARYESKVSRWL